MSQVVVSIEDTFEDWRLKTNQIGQNLYGVELLANSLQDVTWTKATLQNSWTAVSGSSIVSFYRDPIGFIHFRGSLVGGSSGSVAFTLPVGFRPRSPSSVRVTGGFANTASGVVPIQLSIASNGQVTINTAVVTWADLWGISFYVGKNIFMYSEDLSSWTTTNVNCTLTANATTAPDGTVSADKLAENSSTGVHSITRTEEYPIPGPYTYSVYVKDSSVDRKLLLGMYSFSLNHEVIFDITNQTVNNLTPLAGTTAGVETIGSGWYRCWINGMVPNVASNSQSMKLVSGATTQSYAGNGTSGLHIWGSQLEYSLAMTPYASTT